MLFQGNRGTKAILGISEHRNKDFDFGEQENKVIYFRETGEQVFPTGRASIPLHTISSLMSLILKI